MNKLQYREYLKSKHWLEFKESYKHSKYGKRGTCWICYREVPLQLHHISYSRLGREKFEDVRPLCRDCHAKVHDCEGKDLFGITEVLRRKMHVFLSQMYWSRSRKVPKTFKLPKFMGIKHHKPQLATQVWSGDEMAEWRQFWYT